MSAKSATGRYKKAPQLRPDPAPPPATGPWLTDATTRHLRCSLGKRRGRARPRDLYRALALALRDRAVDQMLRTDQRHDDAATKRVYFLSTEYLTGRSLAPQLLGQGVWEQAAGLARDLGLQLSDVLDSEPDAALGNDGLGQTAACLLDSMATLDLPACGYGLNYEFGLFRQEIEDGWQRERPNQWLRESSPWQIERGDLACRVPVYGRIEHGTGRNGHYCPIWLDWHLVVGLPHDVPIVGFGAGTTNRLRLFSARASDAFDSDIFSEADYLRAVEQKMRSELLSKVLYPPGAAEVGKELRLLQEYFLVHCAVNDIVRRHLERRPSVDDLADHAAIHLHGTSVALAIAELLRLLVDEQELAWDTAWAITQGTFSYTNQALVAEALAQWPVDLLEATVPRHLQLIYEINRRFLARVAEVFPEDPALLARASLVQEGHDKRLRMAHLAVAGSHATSDVAPSPAEGRLAAGALPDLRRIFPDRFARTRHGVSQRRWLLQANPELARLISQAIGDSWVTDASHLRQLERSATEESFRERFRRTRRENKERLAHHIAESAGVTADPNSLFDVQVKQIDEHQRQLLNLMRIVHLYLAVTEDGRELAAPRTFVFAGKAPPGYWAAKQIIKCIHGVGQVINRDRRTRDQLRVAFVPDYRVSLAQLIIPAADVGEQLATAGVEACSTGGIKLALNGALTVGTHREACSEAGEQAGDQAGDQSCFSFGLTVDQLAEARRQLSYDARAAYEQDGRLRRVIDTLTSEVFSAGDSAPFAWIRHALVDGGDPWFHLADFDSYLQAHERVSQAFVDRDTWAQRAIVGIARCGALSSDATARAYAEQIWRVRPVQA